MSNNLDFFSKHETEGNKISILSRMLKLPLVILWEAQLFKVVECGRCWARSTHIYVRIIYVYIYMTYIYIIARSFVFLFIYLLKDIYEFYLSRDNAHFWFWYLQWCLDTFPLYLYPFLHCLQERSSTGPSLCLTRMWAFTDRCSLYGF